MKEIFLLAEHNERRYLIGQDICRSVYIRKPVEFNSHEYNNVLKQS